MKRFDVTSFANWFYCLGRVPTVLWILFLTRVIVCTIM
jgi:hypothetical protein